MKILLVIQGRLENEFIVNNLITTYSSIKEDVIISTWNDEDPNLISIIQSEFNVLINDKPEDKGLNNLNLQTTSTKNAIEKYIDSDYTHVLKIRTDMIPSDINLFLKTLSEISEEELVFLCWFEGYEIDYICDFFSFGPKDKSLEFWNTHKDPRLSYFPRSDKDNFFPERYLTWHYTGLANPKFDDIKNIFKFSINELEKNNIKLTRTHKDGFGNNLGLDQVHAYLNITNDIRKNY
jgi:hypothetical protein